MGSESKSGVISNLDHHILEFAQLLREGGIAVNLTEVQDAIQALMLIGLDDKKKVEGALQATLVKSVTQVPWFQEAFRVFFAPPEQKAHWEQKTQEENQSWQKEMAKSHEDLSFKGEAIELTEEQRSTYLRLPEEEKERLKDFIERSEEGTRNGAPVDHSFQPMIQRVLQGSLEYWRRKLEEDDMLIGPPGEGALLNEIEEAMRKKELHYMTRDLKDIPPEEWPEMMKLIRQLSARLASQVSRRTSRGKRGSLDIRRMVRENLRYGGVLINKKYRARRVGRPRFLLLCDVSASMQKYSEFLLQFIYGLSSVVSGIETYVFADRLAPLKSIGQKGQMKSFQDVIDLAINDAAIQWGGGTNLANALDELLKTNPLLFSRRTIFFILSDAQTLESDRAANLLKTIKGRVREVIWLNTLPQRRWHEVKGIEAFQENCQMFECYTLSHLQRIMRAKL